MHHHSRSRRRVDHVISVDERHQRRWHVEQERRHLVRDMARVLHTYGPCDVEDDAAYRRRLARQDDLFALEMDAREDVANDDDGTSDE